MSKKKEKYVGRVNLVCANEACKKEFSTHSSNRTVCHTCKTKCKEVHTFKKAAPLVVAQE